MIGVYSAVASITLSDGAVALGAVVSTTDTFCLDEAECPAMSVAVHVTTVVPSGNSGGASLATAGSGSTESSTIGRPRSTGVSGPDASATRPGGACRYGGMPSSTYAVNSAPPDRPAAVALTATRCAPISGSDGERRIVPVPLPRSDRAAKPTGGEMDSEMAWPSASDARTSTDSEAFQSRPTSGRAATSGGLSEPAATLSTRTDSDPTSGPATSRTYVSGPLAGRGRSTRSDAQVPLPTPEPPYDAASTHARPSCEYCTRRTPPGPVAASTSRSSWIRTGWSVELSTAPTAAMHASWPAPHPEADMAPPRAEPAPLGAATRQLSPPCSTQRDGAEPAAPLCGPSKPSVNRVVDPSLARADGSVAMPLSTSRLASGAPPAASQSSAKSRADAAGYASEGARADRNARHSRAVELSMLSPALVSPSAAAAPPAPPPPPPSCMSHSRPATLAPLSAPDETVNWMGRRSSGMV